MSTADRTVVMGLGNPLMGDDGIGLAALERLRDEWIVPDDVELVDGGTWGMNLLPAVEDATRLLLLDAIRTAEPAGTPVVLAHNQIPRLFATKLSPHQIDLREVLALAELRGKLPGETVAMGLQPQEIAFGCPLSPPVERNLDLLVLLAIGQLEKWGHKCAREEGALRA